MPSEMIQLKALSSVQAQHLFQASNNFLYKAREGNLSIKQHTQQILAVQHIVL